MQLYGVAQAPSLLYYQMVLRKHRYRSMMLRLESDTDLARLHLRTVTHEANHLADTAAWEVAKMLDGSTHQAKIRFLGQLAYEGEFRSKVEQYVEEQRLMREDHFAHLD